MSVTGLQYSSKYSTKFRLYITYALHCIIVLYCIYYAFIRSIHMDTVYSHTTHYKIIK